MSDKKLAATYVLNWNIKLCFVLLFVRNPFPYFPNETFSANLNCTQAFLC